MKKRKYCNVLLPVYNGEKFVRKTIDSVLKQTYPFITLVIIDDGSTDGSRKILKQYLSENPSKIVYIENKYNLGVGQSLYRAYKQEHNADYFAMIGHDDIWPDDYLSSQIAKIEEEDAVVSFAKVRFVNDKGEPINGDDLFSHPLLDRATDAEIFMQLVYKNFLCAPASVVSLERVDREAVCTYWGYNNDKLQDYELWLNLCMQGKMVYNKNISINYRIHENNMSDETKRVLQGKMEYYSTLHRVLFSSDFWTFLRSQRHPEVLFEGILDNIFHNVPFSNPCKLLMLDFCEQLLNQGYQSDRIWYYLNWLYMDSGIITKCLKDGRNLPAKIPVVICGSMKQKEVIIHTLQNDNFLLIEGVQNISPHALCLTHKDNLEYLINQEPFFRNLLHGQVVILCDQKDEDLKKDYPNNLVLTVEEADRRLDKILYSYIEDHTHIWRNGFFDMLTSYDVPEVTAKSVYIRLEEKSIRKIEYMDYLPRDVHYYAESEELEVALDSGEQVLLNDNCVNGGTIRLYSNSGFNIRTRIVINNVLYLCKDVIKDEIGELTFLYEKMSYFNNMTRVNEFFSLNILELNERYQQANTEYRNMINSTYYKCYTKMRDFIFKYKMENAARGIMNVSEKIYRKIYKK